MVKEKQKNWETKERRNDIKNRIRNSGLSRLPTYDQLGGIYGVTKGQICKDMKKILTEMDENELDSTFMDFYQTDLKALGILQRIIHEGNNTDKLRAVTALITLQKGATELLEAFSKKSKVADKVQVEKVNYNFTMNKPKEVVYDIVEEK